jgi:hypothetical protein
MDSIAFRLATKFHSPHELQEYVKEHPDADRSNLKVMTPSEKHRDYEENKKDAGIVERVAARVLQSDTELEAITFPSEEALKDYIKEHPRADPSNHTVKKPKHDDKAEPAAKEHVDQAVKSVKRLGDWLDTIIQDSGKSRDHWENTTNNLPHMMETYKGHLDDMSKGINSIPVGKERERAKKIDRQIDNALESINKEHGYRTQGKRFMSPEIVGRKLKEIKPLVDELDKLLSGQRSLLAFSRNPQAVKPQLKKLDEALKHLEHAKGDMSEGPNFHAYSQAIDAFREVVYFLEHSGASDGVAHKFPHLGLMSKNPFEPDKAVSEGHGKLFEQALSEAKQLETLYEQHATKTAALVERVASRYLQRLADQTQVALTFPREFHLPPHIRPTPAHVPEGTDLAIWTWDQEKESHYGKGLVTLYYGIAFAGKSNKPLWYSSFRTPEARQHEIDDTIKSRKSVIEYKQKQLQEKRDFVHNIQVGEIFVSSWGYDQTNVDFYQVVEIKGKMVVVREIASKDSHSEHGANYVVADPGHFTGPPKLVKPNTSGGFKVGDHYASKWDGKPEYTTPFGMGH